MYYAKCEQTSKPKTTSSNSFLLQVYVLLTVTALSLTYPIQVFAAYTEEENRALSRYTEGPASDSEYFRNPTPITFSKLDPKRHESLLAEMLAFGPVAMEKAGLSSEQVALRYEQIFRVHLNSRSPESLRSIYSQAFEQLVMNANESRESSEQLGQRANYLLLLSSQGDRQTLQNQFCRGFALMAYNNGAKENGNIADFSGVKSLEHVKRLFNVILGSVGNQLSDQCEVINEENGKQKTTTINLGGSLRTISPLLLNYLDNSGKVIALPASQTNPQTISKNSPPSEKCSELQWRCLISDNLRALAEAKHSKKVMFQFQKKSCVWQGRIEKDKFNQFTYSPEFSSHMDQPSDMIKFFDINEFVKLAKSKKVIRESSEFEKKVLSNKSFLDCRSVFQDIPQNQPLQKQTSQSSDANSGKYKSVDSDLGHALFSPLGTR